MKIKNLSSKTVGKIMMFFILSLITCHHVLKMDGITTFMIFIGASFLFTIINSFSVSLDDLNELKQKGKITLNKEDLNYSKSESRMYWIPLLFLLSSIIFEKTYLIVIADIFYCYYFVRSFYDKSQVL